MLDNLIHHSHGSNLLLYLCIMLLLAIIAMGTTKIKQPAVLGQILIGCVVGILAHYKLSFFAQIIHNHTLEFMAELGSIFLLFEIGLESDINEILHCGKQAVVVAATGVILPFILGFFVLTPLISAAHDITLSLFIGSMLAVTSTGISVSVFKDIGIIKHKACQIVLAASIIDDITGLILLSIITGLVTFGHIDVIHVLLTLVCVILFFAFSIFLGNVVLPQVVHKITAKISLSNDMLTLTLVGFCLLLSWLAQIIGLAAIIGAFMAGLLLEEKYFSDYPVTRQKPTPNPIFTDSNSNITAMVTPIGKIFIPIFFIYAGMQVDIISAMNSKTIILAVVISLFAVVSKAFCGMFLPKTINRWIVGFGMVPRGEIGIIFALTGLECKLIDNNLFTALLLMIVITSVITPIMINYLSAKVNPKTN